MRDCMSEAMIDILTTQIRYNLKTPYRAEPKLPSKLHSLTTATPNIKQRANSKSLQAYLYMRLPSIPHPVCG